MAAANPILAHKLGKPRAVSTDPDKAPPTPMRQMRRALGRAADEAVGLSTSVLGIAEEDLDAEAMIEDAPDDWVVLGLRDSASAGLAGLFLLDPALRSALVEMQTMGHLLSTDADQRAVTLTDAALCVPFASTLLGELATVGFGATDFTPAAYDIGPIDDLRTAGLVMVQGTYRMWRITIQMGGGDAQGEMMIAMRPKVTNSPSPIETSSTWSDDLRVAVGDAPTELDAILARMTLPINKVEAFEIGQVLQLAGTTVGSVMLCGARGKKIAAARLGQFAGKRAVRLEKAQVELQDDPPRQVGGPHDALTPPQNDSVVVPDASDEVASG